MTQNPLHEKTIRQYQSLTHRLQAYGFEDFDIPTLLATHPLDYIKSNLNYFEFRKSVEGLYHSSTYLAEVMEKNLGRHKEPLPDAPESSPRGDNGNVVYLDAQSSKPRLDDLRRFWKGLSLQQRRIIYAKACLLNHRLDGLVRNAFPPIDPLETAFTAHWLFADFCRSGLGIAYQSLRSGQNLEDLNVGTETLVVRKPREYKPFALGEIISKIVSDVPPG